MKSNLLSKLGGEEQDLSYSHRCLSRHLVGPYLVFFSVSLHREQQRENVGCL